ncbi:MAG: GGDEF and EAL domain-containing protein [Nitrospirota bacterium]
MSDSGLNFDALRCQISRENGNVLENLIREDFLVNGIIYSIRDITLRLKEKCVDNEGISSDLVKLVEFFKILMGLLDKSIVENKTTIKNSLFKSLRVVDALEKSSVDSTILEKLTAVLMKIVLSRENVINWEKRAEEIIKDLYGIYQFDVYFNIFETKNKKLEAYLFLMRDIDDDGKGRIKDKLQLEIRRYFEITDILDTIPMEYVDVPLGSEKLENAPKDILIKTHEYLTDTPGIGGLLGIGMFHEKEIDSKDMDIIESLLSIMTMVTGSARALSKAISELEFYAGHDPLTGLYNRRMFEHFLEYEVLRVKRKGYKFSMLMQDLDDFKYINDNYGHPFGDLFLKEVASTLNDSLRDGDIVARLGGDEFAVILSETDIVSGKIVAEKIKNSFTHKKIETPDKKIIPIKASIGLVEFPTHGQNRDELMLVVDAALYKAKELGKNKIFIPTDNEIKNSLKEQTQKFNILQEGIDKSAFIPYFQPILDVTSRRIAGYEVLARLKDSSGKIIPAFQFINMAERIGKIFEIDRQVISKAFRYKKEKDNHDYMFINLSGKELKDKVFLEFVIEEAKANNLTPSEIVIEITEREAAGDLSKIQEFIQTITSNGFNLAIDDFGSGYSSFYYIKYIPVNFLKIDGEFIKELATGDVRDYAFVESIQTLCSKLKLKTIAEFIESQKIMEIIGDIGVNYGQGYHLGMPSADFVT